MRRDEGLQYDPQVVDERWASREAEEESSAAERQKAEGDAD
jgi:hypothetical protein